MTKIAIVGATGAVGREMMEELGSSSLQIDELGLFASARSAGSTLEFRGASYPVIEFTPEKLSGFDYVLMSAGGGFSKEFSPKLVELGCVVIDNSSAWRMAPDAPLIVPEVNGDELEDIKKPCIIANPNCSTIQMVVALKPLQDAFGLMQVQVATYQSVSGTGQSGIKELATQVEQQLKFEDVTPDVYAQPIAFSLLPAIDRMDETGHAYEEVKMVQETRKILRRPELAVMATTVRVPTFNCHGEAVTVQLGEEVTREQAWQALREQEGLRLEERDDHAHFPTPRSMVGRPDVIVSRLRLPFGSERSSWLQFWNVADNLKKGAATNAVQILSRLVSTTGA